MLNLPCEKIFNDAFLTGNLNLCSRQLKEFPIHYAQCYDISDVVNADLSNNYICELPACVCEWHSLETLRFCSNGLRSIPASISSLHSLSFLDLSNNHLTTLPSTFFTLPLSVLILAGNRLESLSSDIKNLAETLQELDLRANRLRQLPTPIASLTELRLLNVCANQLKDLPRELGCLSLRMLDVSTNLLIRLPVELHKLADTCSQLKTDGNPLMEPPMSVVQRVSFTLPKPHVVFQGNAHVFKWLSARAEQLELKFGSVEPGTQYLNSTNNNGTLYNFNNYLDFTRVSNLNATIRRSDRASLQRNADQQMRKYERRSRSIKTTATCSAGTMTMSVFSGTDSGYITGDDQHHKSELALSGRAAIANNQQHHISYIDETTEYPTSISDEHMKGGELVREILMTFEQTKMNVNRVANGHPPSPSSKTALADLSNNNTELSDYHAQSTLSFFPGSAHLDATALAPNATRSSVLMSANSAKPPMQCDQRAADAKHSRNFHLVDARLSNKIACNSATLTSSSEAQKSQYAYAPDLKQNSMNASNISIDSTTSSQVTILNGATTSEPEATPQTSPPLSQHESSTPTPSLAPSSTKQMSPVIEPKKMTVKTMKRTDLSKSTKLDTARPNSSRMTAGASATTKTAKVPSTALKKSPPTPTAARTSKIASDTVKLMTTSTSTLSQSKRSVKPTTAAPVHLQSRPSTSTKSSRQQTSTTTRRQVASTTSGFSLNLARTRNSSLSQSAEPTMCQNGLTTRKGSTTRGMSTTKVQPVTVKEPIVVQNGVSKRPLATAMSKSIASRSATATTTSTGQLKRVKSVEVSATRTATSVGSTVNRMPKSVLTTSSTHTAFSCMDVTALRQHLNYMLKDIKLEASGEKLAQQLSDGVLLCQFLNALAKQSITVVRPTSASSLSVTRSRRNVENFVAACRELGVPESFLCHSVDIMERKNLAITAQTVSFLVDKFHQPACS